MNRYYFSLTAIVLIATGTCTGLATASELSTEQILEQLAPKKPLTRSLTKKPKMANKDRDFLKSLGNTRGIKFIVNEGSGKNESTDYKQPTYQENEIDKVVEITKQYDLPKLEFKINFDFGSSNVSGDSLTQVINLAKALGHPSMADARIILGGHTDAKGSDAFNQILSQKRSDAVAQLVVKIGHIDPSRLVPLGYGEHELKNTNDPHADENRRVEVINISEY